MVSAPLHGAVCHLRNLRAGQALGELSDAQLLERFAREHEEASFAALVRRHGPMVWSVARRVLANRHDAEDVFQATFLLLARKASSIRKAESVAGFLHGVAHRLALKTRLQQARRQAREQQAADRRQTMPSSEPALSEIQSALDTALAQLPEKYRAALVLCYLEGHTQDQAARRLGCPLATLRTRVVRGRKLLRQRLAKQGLTLSTAAVAVLAISSATAAPVALVAAVVTAALPFAAGQPAAQLCSAQAAGLVEGGLKTMFLTRVKTVTVLLLAACLVAGAAALAQRLLAAGDAATQPPVATRPKPAGVDDREPIAYAGRVLGPDGKPVSGAKIVHKNYGATATEEATTGRDGRFVFKVPKAKGFDDRYTVVAATAAGHGVVWVRLWPKDKRDGLTLRLVKDDVPLTGRIFDLQGKPIAGATVTVLSISAASGEDLDTWLESARVSKVRKGASLDSYAIARPVRITTDAAGRFRLGGAGLGRNRLVRVRLDGPTIASQFLTILTRPGKALPVKEYEGQPRPTTCYGADFRHAAAPTRPVVGVVRDRDTKKPLAGVTIESNRLAGNDTPGMNIVQTTTDASGRYRLIGLPGGKGNKVRLVPADGQPYLSVHADVPDSPGLDAVTVDFELKRGVWIKGKVTDKVTGKPVQGYVDYFALAGNPNVRDHPGFHGTIPPRWGVATGEDGSYRVVGLPGPGLIVMHTTGRHLTTVERDDEFGMKEQPVSTAPYQLAPLINYPAVARIDPARGIDSTQRNLTLDPGWTFTGKLLGPDGKPLAGALGFGVNDRFPPWNPNGIRAAEFTVRKFNPRGPHDILFQHRDKGLIGVAPPPKANGAVVTVRMQPGAAVKGRLVGADGKPRAGVELELTFRPKGTRRGWPAWWSDYSPAHIRTDRDGRFRIEALLPGYEFRLQGDRGNLPFTVLRSGQTTDLGDVQMKQAEK
jgi:RNA polymerase sigma factor (sigma-70 family)